MICPPELITFVIEREQQGEYTHSWGESEHVIVDYYDNRDTATTWFESQGTVQYANPKRSRYRQRVKLPIGSWTIADYSGVRDICIENNELKFLCKFDTEWNINVTGRAYDLNGDGIVNGEDIGIYLTEHTFDPYQLGILLANWG